MHEAALTPLVDLHPHEQNYRAHPRSQRAHIVASIQEHGLYRNVVVARDGTILAGHGVVEAAREAGLAAIPVVRLPLDPDDPAALKLLAGDNEVGRLAAIDDRMLADLLRSLDADDLLGTGYDEATLADLLRVADATGDGPPPEASWVGMPEFESEDRHSAAHVTVHFKSEGDAARFFELIGVARGQAVWWPTPDEFVGSTMSEQWVASS